MENWPLRTENLKKEQHQLTTKTIGKLKPPSIMDQTKEEQKSGTHINDEENDLICQINNASI